MELLTFAMFIFLVFQVKGNTMRIPTIDVSPGCYWFNGTVGCPPNLSIRPTASVELYEWNIGSDHIQITANITVSETSSQIGTFSFHTCVYERGVGDRYVELFFKFRNVCDSYRVYGVPFKNSTYHMCDTPDCQVS